MPLSKQVSLGLIDGAVVSRASEPRQDLNFELICSEETALAVPSGYADPPIQDLADLLPCIHFWPPMGNWETGHGVYAIYFRALGRDVSRFGVCFTTQNVQEALVPGRLRKPSKGQLPKNADLSPTKRKFPASFVYIGEASVLRNRPRHMSSARLVDTKSGVGCITALNSLNHSLTDQGAAARTSTSTLNSGRVNPDTISKVELGNLPAFAKNSSLARMYPAMCSRSVT